MSYIQDWVNTEGYVDPKEIDQRIDYLRASVDAGEDDDEEVDELNELIAFRAVVSGQVYAWDRATIVADSQFAGHIRGWVEEIIGGELDMICHRVDWDGVADDHKADWHRIGTKDEAFYVR